MIWVRTALLWLTLLCGTTLAHEITFSQIDVLLGDGRIDLNVKLPIKALLHEEPSPLPAGITEDSLKTTTRSPELQSALRGLLTGRLQLGSPAGALPMTVTDVETAGEDVALTATAPPPQGTLDLAVNLFPDDALHKEFVSIYRGGALVGQYALDAQNSKLSVPAPGQTLVEVITTFVVQGIHHIFIGPDHILFVIALILLGGRLASQLKIITAFTVAHSITLTLATLDVVQLPSRLVENVIALSIVVVGLHDLWRLKRGEVFARRGPDWRILFAFVFGLVHGFGFASVLTELHLPTQALAWSLASFNVGVEIGQLAIVLIAAPTIFALRRLALPQVSQGIFSAIAAIVVVVGSYWLWQRGLSG